MGLPPGVVISSALGEHGGHVLGDRNSAVGANSRGLGRRRDDQPRRIPRRHSERRVVEQGRRLQSRLGQCPETGWAAGRICQRRVEVGIFTSILNRTLLGSTSTPPGISGPALVSCICREVELPDSTQATWPQRSTRCPQADPSAASDVAVVKPDESQEAYRRRRGRSRSVLSMMTVAFWSGRQVARY
jgi:hypothetical protein